MQFSHSNATRGRKAGKFALIAGLHVAVGILFVQSLNSRHLSLPALPSDLTVEFKPDPPAPVTPPDPIEPMPTLAPPRPVVVPIVEVPAQPPQDPSPILATTVPDPQPMQPAQPSNAAASPAPQAGTPARTNANAGQIRTAVFADANGCALPRYPAVAARNGDAGTTTLALLVGADGRVTSARVERTSGSRELDRAALQALSLCQFKPATNNGVAESGWARLAYVWTLD
jgi:protein TonB